MTVILKSDIFKIKISKYKAIALVSLVSVIMVIIITQNILYLGSYDHQQVSQIMQKEKPSQSEVDAYVRMRAILTIVGNCLLLATFGGFVTWSVNKKRFGLFFGTFWSLIFLANGIGSLFYLMQLNAFTIIIAIFNLIVAILMGLYVIELMQVRARIRQEMARSK